MVLLRRSLLILSSLVIAISITGLLNFTAPNPTGRRYSSSSPDMIGSSQQRGDEGEAILAQDLRLPNNNAPSQGRCLCSEDITEMIRQCSICVARLPISTSSGQRIPDFVSNGFIAEAKNTRVLSIADADIASQITEYAAAAHLLNIPLYLYVRVNTQLSPEFITLAAATGGAVIPYFTVPGYVDPVDQATSNGLLIAVPIFALTLVGDFASTRRRRRSFHRPKSVSDPADNAEAFLQRSRERQQARIDREDSRGSS